MALADHLANERTFLAWLRTALAVLAFGFVLERFSLYLPDAAAPTRGILKTSHLGYGLIWIGMGLILMALWRYLVEARDIDHNLHRAYRRWPVIAVATLFIGVGLYLAFILMA